MLLACLEYCERWIEALQKRQAEKVGRGSVCDAKGWLECKELSLGIGHESVKSLCVRIRGQTNRNDAEMGTCYA